jgi:hypothetical protein
MNLTIQIARGIRHSREGGNPVNLIIPCEARAKVNGMLFKSCWIPAFAGMTVKGII